MTKKTKKRKAPKIVRYEDPRFSIFQRAAIQPSSLNPVEIAQLKTFSATAKQMLKDFSPMFSDIDEYSLRHLNNLIRKVEEGRHSELNNRTVADCASYMDSWYAVEGDEEEYEDED